MRTLKTLIHVTSKDHLAVFGASVLALVVILGVFGPHIAPYDPQEPAFDSETGEIVRLQPPSLTHPFGTTDLGQDVFSQVLHGAQPALLVGVISALLVATVGTAVGLLAGYWRGTTDSVLMRLVDVAYSMPFEPAALLLAVVLGPSTWTLIAAMGLLMWRTPARIARAQTLSYAQRPFVKAARCAGISHTRIMLRHIAPNVVGVNVLYVPVAVGWAVIAQATVSFLGFGDPETVSWGSILQFAFASGAIREAWWWTLAPGLAIVLMVSSTFFVSRPFESVINPQLRGVAW